MKAEICAFILSGALLLSFFPKQEAKAQKDIRVPVEDYRPGEQNAGSKIKWEPLKLSGDKTTSYDLIKDSAGDSVIRARSRNSASGLIYSIKIDPKQYPVIEWRWKVDSVVEKGDLRKKKSDDYAARIYITFEYDTSRLGLGEKIKYWGIKTFTGYEIPLRSINYVWANKAEEETIAPNAFTGWVQMVVCQSGEKQAGMWVTEKRNIYEDYKKAFGEEPGKITGIAIMTDSDNTGGSATGYYGDIVFKQPDP